MPNIYEKIQACRVELQNMNLKKSGKNKFAGYEYYELTDFLPKINILFEAKKLFSNFSITQNEATLTIINTEDETQTVDFISPIEELELKGCNKIQALGGIHTYLKRYLYVNALEIVENEMFDGMQPQELPKNKYSDKTSDADIDLIQGLYEQISTKACENYYKTYKDTAVDKEAFKQEYAKTYTKLKAKENNNANR